MSVAHSSAQNGPKRAQNGRRGWGGCQGLRRLSEPPWVVCGLLTRRETAKPLAPTPPPSAILGPFWAILGHFGPFGHFGHLGHLAILAIWGHFDPFWPFWAILAPRCRSPSRRPKMAQNGRRRWGGGQGLRRLSPREQPTHYPRWLRETAKSLVPTPPPSAILGPFWAIWPFWAIFGIWGHFGHFGPKVSVAHLSAQNGPKWPKEVGWGPRASPSLSA